MKDYDNEQPIETASVPTYLSLCSGYDGIGIALKRVIPELRTIAHVEIEAFAICNLVTKMEEGKLDSAPVFTDLKRFPFEDLRERQPSILSAGFPCQPFSSAGKRQATDDPRHLYPFIADGITACRPEYVFLENVEGIVSSKTADGESVLLYVLRDLESRGYTCSWGTFSAAEIVGADGRRIPHLRKRVFILAKLADGESIERQRTESIGDRCERPEETVGGSGSYMADGVSTGLEGHAGDVDETTGQTGRGTHRPISESGLSRTVYPSRPGERQYEWEEPRVVGGELADTKSGESGESQAGNRRKDTGGGSEISERERAIDAGREATDSEEEYVGDASSDGRRSDQPSTQDGGVVGEGEEGRLSESPRGRSQELGNASSERSHRGSEDGTDVEPEVSGTGHESYVADESNERRRGRTRNSNGDEKRFQSDTQGRNDLRGEAERRSSDTEAVSSEAQSELGGTVDVRKRRRGVDAITNRVDRLRLLGNGVVPDCAELAFRTLFNQLHNEQ